MLGHNATGKSKTGEHTCNHGMFSDIHLHKAISSSACNTCVISCDSHGYSNACGSTIVRALSHQVPPPRTTVWTLLAPLVTENSR